MYKLNKDIVSGAVVSVSKLNADDSGVCIPFDPANTDYQQFKAQINADEAELETPEGDVMPAEQAKAYVATLP